MTLENCDRVVVCRHPTWFLITAHMIIVLYTRVSAPSQNEPPALTFTPRKVLSSRTWPIKAVISSKNSRILGCSLLNQRQQGA